MEIRRGLLDDPRWLAAAIGGIASAIAALWAMRGLPLGFAAVWLASLPIFAAGFGFGSFSALGALGIGTLIVLMFASEWPALIYLLGFALPALLMVATGLRGGRLDASGPLALTGIWPALVILLVAVLLADSPGGFDGALIDSVKQGLARMGMADAGMPVEQLALIMAPAMAGWMVAALIICGIGAQTALTRRGMALAATPLWRETRLPMWYGFLPGSGCGDLAERHGRREQPADCVVPGAIAAFFSAGACRGASAFRRPHRPALHAWRILRRACDLKRAGRDRGYGLRHFRTMGAAQ